MHTRVASSGAQDRRSGPESLLVACRQEVTEVAGPGGAPPVDTTGTATVQRLTLTVTVQADPADADVAR